jgi:hypothetical protein
MIYLAIRRYTSSFSSGRKNRNAVLFFLQAFCHMDAGAVESTKAIFFYGTRLRDEAEKDYSLGYELMKRMAEIVIQRLQAARQQLVEQRSR